MWSVLPRLQLMYKFAMTFPLSESWNKLFPQQTSIHKSQYVNLLFLLAHLFILIADLFLSFSYHNNPYFLLFWLRVSDDVKKSVSVCTIMTVMVMGHAYNWIKQDKSIVAMNRIGQNFVCTWNYYFFVYIFFLFSVQLIINKGRWTWAVWWTSKLHFNDCRCQCNVVIIIIFIFLLLRACECISCDKSIYFFHDWNFIIKSEI